MMEFLFLESPACWIVMLGGFLIAAAGGKIASKKNGALGLSGLISFVLGLVVFAWGGLSVGTLAMFELLSKT